jgi:tetratricopeptide (TPR) repeat protein
LLGLAIRALEQVKEAKTVALRGLELHPDEAILHFNLACYLSLLGDYDNASDHLNKAIKLDRRFQAASVEDEDLAGLWGEPMAVAPREWRKGVRMLEDYQV